MPIITPASVGSASNSGATTSLTITVGTTVPIGSTVIVMGRVGGGNTMTSVTDSGGNTYVKDVASAAPTGSNMTIFSSVIKVGLVNSNSITVSFPSSSNASAAAYLVTGALALSSVHLDQTASNFNTATGTGPLVVGPTSALSNYGEIAFAGLALGGAGTLISAGGSWNLLNTVSFASFFSLLPGTSRSALTASFAWAGSFNSGGAIATYKPTNMGAMFSTFIN